MAFCRGLPWKLSAALRPHFLSHIRTLCVWLNEMCRKLLTSILYKLTMTIYNGEHTGCIQKTLDSWHFMYITLFHVHAGPWLSDSDGREQSVKTMIAWVWRCMAYNNYSPELEQHNNNYSECTEAYLISYLSDWLKKNCHRFCDHVCVVNTYLLGNGVPLILCQ